MSPAPTADEKAAPSAASRNASDTQLLDNLLEDAKTVALYVQRAGLVGDTRLPKAIADVDQLTVKTWHDPAVVQLQLELHRTMTLLSPTTLQDLKGPGAPFRNSTWTSVQSMMFMVLSILMVATAGWLTLAYNQGTALTASIHALQESKAEERLSTLIREIVASPIPTGAKESASETLVADGNQQGTDQPPGQTLVINSDTTSDDDVFWRTQPIGAVAAESYMAKLQEARALDKEISVWVELATDFWTTYEGVANILGNRNGPATIAQSGQYNPCTQAEVQRIGSEFQNTQFSTTPMWTLIRSHLHHAVVVTCMVNMKYHVIDFPVLGHVVDNIGLIVNMFGLWILPALYGALGAALYHMRRVLNPILPNPSLLRILHRITVSAFSGIVIAWIWAPSAQANEDFRNIGVNLFVVAFLVGYSIDIFFTLLDRLVTNVTGSIGKMGTQQTATTTTTTT